MTKSDLLRLSRIKANALKLRSNYQLPYYLVYLINNVNKDSSVDYVKYLTSQCDHMLRVKGYYKRYPLIEREYENALKKDVTTLFGLAV